MIDFYWKCSLKISNAEAFKDVLENHLPLDELLRFL